VTDAGQLLGTWTTRTLDGQDVHAVRASGGRPLALTFVRLEGELRWHANDIVNAHSGTFTVSPDGRFHASETMSTMVGSIGNRPRYKRNPQAVQQATEARLVTVPDGSPPTLKLLDGSTVLAVYTSHSPQ
jgi:hypothetical protein